MNASMYFSCEFDFKKLAKVTSERSLIPYLKFPCFTTGIGGDMMNDTKDMQTQLIFKEWRAMYWQEHHALPSEAYAEIRKEVIAHAI